jgi:hypothetical protein
MKDRLAALDRHNTPGREAATVANWVDAVKRGDSRVSGSQKVGVQRMHLTLAGNGAAGGYQRLGCYLATKDAGGRRWK